MSLRTSQLRLDRIRTWRLKDKVRCLGMMPGNVSPVNAGYVQAGGRNASSNSGDKTSSPWLEKCRMIAQETDRNDRNDRTWKPSQAISFHNVASSSSIAEVSHQNVGYQPDSQSTYPSLAGPDVAEEIYDTQSISAAGLSLSVFEDLHSNIESPPGNGIEIQECSSQDTDEPFCTPLGYHIPKARLQSALDAAPESPSAYWQYTLYRGPGGDKDTVKVHYCKNKDTAEKIAQLFLEEKVIGFDIEWKSNATADDGIKKNVSLVQIASEQRVALFHIARFPGTDSVEDFVPLAFKQIMESSEITKVGVSIKGDCTRLRRFMGIDCRGLFELSHLYKLIKYSTEDVRKVNKMLVSLASQVKEHLHLPLWKGEVRSSDWSADLNYQQIQYAASDSYAGFHLYHALEAKRLAMDPTPPRPAHAELNLPIKLADGKTAESTEASADIVGFQAQDGITYPDISVEEILHDFPNFKIGDRHPCDVGPESLTKYTDDPCNPSSSTATKTQPEPKSTSTPASPEVSAANAWVNQYTHSRMPQPAPGKTSAKPAELRAYALWHGQTLEVPRIASLLRDPPLQKSTVVSYIIRAVVFDDLPYEPERIAGVEQHGMAYGISSARWERLKKGEMKDGDA